jgi:hypothetical protein
MAVVDVQVAAFDVDPQDKQIPAVADKKYPAAQVTWVV